MAVLAMGIYDASSFGKIENHLYEKTVFWFCCFERSGLHCVIDIFIGILSLLPHCKCLGYNLISSSPTGETLGAQKVK